MTLTIARRAHAKALVIAGVAAWTAWMLWFAVERGVRHDYILYLKQWALVGSGTDPWSTDNAYGPLHVVLAFLLPLGPLAPKLLMVGLMLAANIALVLSLIAVRPRITTLVIHLIAISGNFVVISIGAAYGLNDSLVAAMITLAVLLRLRDFLVAAGIVLGLAILTKYYPAVLVPLFAIEGRRFRFTLIASALATTAAGLATAYALWGGQFLAAVRFGADRAPTMLSVLAALSSAPDLVGGPDKLNWLVDHNALFVIVGAVIAVAVAWWQRVHWLEASAGTLLAILLLYKVGHPQFFLPWLFLVAALPLAKTPSADRMALLCLPFALLVSAFQWGYSYGSDGYHAVLGWVRADAGFAAFPLGCATIAASLWMLRSDRRFGPPAQHRTRRRLV